MKEGGRIKIHNSVVVGLLWILDKSDTLSLPTFQVSTISFFFYIFQLIIFHYIYIYREREREREREINNLNSKVMNEK